MMSQVGISLTAASPRSEARLSVRSRERKFQLGVRTNGHTNAEFEGGVILNYRQSSRKHNLVHRLFYYSYYPLCSLNVDCWKQKAIQGPTSCKFLKQSYEIDIEIPFSYEHWRKRCVRETLSFWEKKMSINLDPKFKSLWEVILPVDNC